MGKSTKSKWKRKMKAVKRVRYAVKELAMLKKTVQNGPTDASEIDFRPQRPGGDTPGKTAVVKKYNSLMQDKHGHYPIWMNQKRIKKHKALVAKMKNGGRKKKKSLKRL